MCKDASTGAFRVHCTASDGRKRRVVARAVVLATGPVGAAHSAGSALLVIIVGGGGDVVRRGGVALLLRGNEAPWRLLQDREAS